MENIEMQSFDINCEMHLNFSYEILKQRSKKNIVEISFKKNSKFKLPTFKEHKDFFKKNINQYKFFYIIMFKDIPFAEIYLNKNYELGVYQHFTNLKKIRKTNKNIRPHANNIIIYDIFHKILKKHKDEIPYIIGKINTNNTLSINGVKKLGFTKLYECYIIHND